jgi:hypothetical protein
MSETNGEVKRYSLKRKVVVIELEGEDGTVSACELREMNGTERDRFLNTSNRRLKTDSQGNAVGVSDFNGIYADLIAQCLYREGALVPKSEILNFPASLQADLHRICQEINSLGDKAREAAKNG